MGGSVDINIDLGKAWKSVEDTATHIANDMLSLDAIPKFTDELWYYVSGNEQRDRNRLQSYKDRLDSYNTVISNIQSDLSSKRFLEDIFKYSDQRNLKSNISDYNQLAQEAQALYEKYKKKTTESDTLFSQILLFAPKVVSRFTYDIVDFISTGDFDKLLEAVEIYMLVVAIVIAIVVGLVAIVLGGGSGIAMFAVIASMFALLASVLTLDGMVNNSGLLKASFKFLDTVANDMLGLYKYFDTKGVSTDSEYYEGNLAFTKMSISVLAVITSLGSSYYMASTQTAEQLQAQSIADSMKSATEQTFEGLHNIYTNAMNAYNVSEAVNAKSKLDKKLNDFKAEIESNIVKLNREKMEASFSDASYIVNQVDKIFTDYELQLSEAKVTDVFDPEGTITMNTRYQVKPSYMFGFENMFNYNNMAGGNDYVYHTIWASKRNEI